MNETIFLDKNDVKVTNSRFIVNAKTYAIAAINSVNVKEVDVTPSNTFPGILTVVGITWMFGCVYLRPEWPNFVWSLSLTIAGIVWLSYIKKTVIYTLIITTSSGELSALESKNETEIRPIELAINEAIVARG